MPSPTLCLSYFEGASALSNFRRQTLLQRLQAQCPRINAVSARHVHWVASAAPLSAAQHDKVQALLDPGHGAVAGANPGAKAEAAGSLVVVMPRLGTVSPWASKATDIARNCGLTLKRIERVTEYSLLPKASLMGARKPLTEAELACVLPLLHDRMTEAIAFERGAAARLFEAQQAAPMVHNRHSNCKNSIGISACPISKVS